METNLYEGIYNTSANHRHSQRLESAEADWDLNGPKRCKGRQQGELSFAEAAGPPPYKLGSVEKRWKIPIAEYWTVLQANVFLDMKRR